MAPSASEFEQRCETSHIQQHTSNWNELSVDKNGSRCVFNGSDIGRLLAHDTLKQRVESIDTNVCEAGKEDAFFVADMGEVYRQHLRWKLKLKRVKPHYGMLFTGAGGT